MNPITDFNAREFLTFYALFILAVWMVKAWFDRHSDRTLDETWTPPVMTNAYDIAYLRGGAHELARVAIVGLTERGFLEVRTGTIGQATDHPTPATLTSLERSVFDFFQPERTVREIEQAGLRVRLNPHLLSYEERMQSQQLLSPPTVINPVHRGLLAGAAIALVGVARFLVALQRHRPAGFLIAMGIVGTIVVAWPRVERLSRRGKACLNSLRAEASSFNARDTESSDTSLFMASALFGMTALSGSPHEALGELFTRQQKAASAASSCGAWFGGGGDSGGGDSGGGAGGGGGSDGGGGGASCGGGGGCGGCGGG